jgi:hypothetical protein
LRKFILHDFRELCAHDVDQLRDGYTDVGDRAWSSLTVCVAVKANAVRNPSESTVSPVVINYISQRKSAPEFCQADLGGNVKTFPPGQTKCFRHLVFPVNRGLTSNEGTEYTCIVNVGDLGSEEHRWRGSFVKWAKWVSQLPFVASAMYVDTFTFARRSTNMMANHASCQIWSTKWKTIDSSTSNMSYLDSQLNSTKLRGKSR